MMITSQIARLQNIRTKNFLNTLRTVATYTDHSLFLSEAEINSFMLLDLDEDSMNESLGIDVLEGWSGNEFERIAA